MVDRITDLKHGVEQALRFVRDDERMLRDAQSRLHNARAILAEREATLKSALEVESAEKC